MKNIKPFELLLMLCYIVPITCFCQDYKDYIDPTWDKYYDRNPSEIVSNFQGSDFIRVIEIVILFQLEVELKEMQICLNEYF